MSGLATAFALAACSGETEVAAATPASAAAHDGMSFEQQNALISEYCVTCHNFDEFAGGFELIVFRAEDAATNADNVDIAERVIRKIRAGMMPPAGEPRPDFETAQAFAAALEASVDANTEYDPGFPGLHRLNRTEYANVVRDLLGLEVDVTTLLPSDDSSNGFDNQASLGLSPVLLEAYLSAAGKIAQLAVGSADTPSQTLYRVPEDTTQNYHVDGLPFGTRGGTLIEHNFPVDGTYTFKVYSVNLGNMGNFRPFGEVRGEQLEILVDGERVGLFDWDVEFGITPRPGAVEGDDDGGQLRTIDVTVPVTAGPHQVGVTFLASNYAPGLDLNNAFDRTTIETGGLPGFTFYPHVGRVRIDGPVEVSGPGDTPSRRMIFTCQPASAAEEPACAEEILSGLARRAYRGHQTADDVATLAQFYEVARAEGGDFDAGVEAALQRMLSDPKFIYRVEAPPADAPGGLPYAISDLELASRLSFFLWSSMPDEELLSVAEAGNLRDHETLEAQISRMLTDPRSIAFTENFAGQWLALRNLEGHVPVVSEFPDFDDNLRQAFRRETELFFDSLVRDDRSVFELLTADYTFVNERLARHYGIPGVRGSRFRRIDLADYPERHGILGKGSLLTVTSQPGRTSPVIRGNWVLGNLIGTPAPPPPPDVPEIETQTADAAGNTRVPTIREQYEAHRVDPACSGCHRMMDPIGFSLEPFDATGRLRAEDAGLPIDPTGVMYDGSPINGPDDLRSFIMKYDEAYVRNIAEKMLTYAVGRGMDRHDMPVVRSIARQAAENEYGFHALITAVVESQTFQMNTKPLEVAGADAEVPPTGARATSAGAG